MRKQLISKHLTAALMLGGLAMLVAGCSSDHYYRVTHPTSGNEYYTTKIEDSGKGGAVKIKDEKTGSMVTLQSHDVKEISEGEYRAGLTAPAKPAPVQPAAVQPAPAKPAPVQPAAVQPAPAQPAAVQPAAAQAAPAQP
jgi:hypothetical protein